MDKSPGKHFTKCKESEDIYNDDFQLSGVGPLERGTQQKLTFMLPPLSEQIGW